MPQQQNNRVFQLLWAACVLLLAGRMYQHLFFEAPYRAFFLKQEYFGWAVAWFSDQEWVAFVNDLETDRTILSFGRAIGVYFGLTALSTLALKSRYHAVVQGLLYGASVLLLFMAVSYYLDKGFQLAQIMEYTAQVITPALLAWHLYRPESKGWQWVLRLAIGLTFLGHGLYALGMYPVPGNFIHMVIVNALIVETGARLREGGFPLQVYPSHNVSGDREGVLEKEEHVFEAYRKLMAQY